MTAMHPADDNGVDLGSSSYSYKDAHIQGTANIGNLNLSVASPITGTSTFNGSESIIPVNTSNSQGFTITIDKDQCVAGRILIFKHLNEGRYFNIDTEGSEKIQGKRTALADSYSVVEAYETVYLFSDGSNWYDLTTN